MSLDNELTGLIIGYTARASEETTSVDVWYSMFKDEPTPIVQRRASLLTRIRYVAGDALRALADRIDGGEDGD